MNNSSYYPGNYTGDDGDGYDDLYDPPLAVVVFLSLCYGSISVAAVAGNGLVIWVILTSRRMRNVTNYYIANLALADIAIGMFAIPFEFQAAMLQRWVLPHFMCPFCPFVKILSISVSVFTLCAIALDRCMAILYPLTCRARFSRLHFRVISIIWICGLMMASPMLYILQVQPHGFFYGEWFCAPRPGFEPWMHYVHLTQVIFLYSIPFLVISVAYAIMGHTLWGATAPGNAQSERDSNILRNKKKVIKMLSIVVVLFGLCWLPLQIYNAIQDITDINEFRYINILWFGMDWLAMSNSCYNPFIYAIYNEKFKREFQLRLRAPCLKKRKKNRPLNRELSGFESSRFDWRKSTMENGKTSVITLH